jgi:hypothetical protein
MEALGSDEHSSAVSEEEQTGATRVLLKTW